jgi:hypothetical protein
MTDNGEAQTLITDDEIEDIEETRTVEKTKKAYVMTDARKKALEKGRATRAKKVAESREVKNEEKEMSKLNKQKAKARQVLGITEQEQEDLDEDEEEVVVVKKKKVVVVKKKKQKIVYETDSSSSSDDEPPTVERKPRNAYKEKEIRTIIPDTPPFRLKRV